MKAAGPYTVLAISEHRAFELAPRVQCSRRSVLANSSDGKAMVGAYRNGIFGLAVDVGASPGVAALEDLELGSSLISLAGRKLQTAYEDQVTSGIGYMRD